jgi:hypothetical protein
MVKVKGVTVEVYVMVSCTFGTLMLHRVEYINEYIKGESSPQFILLRLHHWGRRIVPILVVVIFLSKCLVLFRLIHDRKKWHCPSFLWNSAKNVCFHAVLLYKYGFFLQVTVFQPFLTTVKWYDKWCEIFQQRNFYNNSLFDSVIIFNKPANKIQKKVFWKPC